jgi:hypothetical protein
MPLQYDADLHTSACSQITFVGRNERRHSARKQEAVWHGPGVQSFADKHCALAVSTTEYITTKKTRGCFIVELKTGRKTMTTAFDVQFQAVRDWQREIDLSTLSLLRALALDFCSFDSAAVDALNHCAAHMTRLTSLRLIRDVIDSRVDANAHSSDAFLTHFVAQDRLVAFGKSPVEAVSATMLRTLIDWFRHTTCLASLWFSDHIGNLGLGVPQADELASTSALLDAAIRCTTLHSLSMEGMWRSLPYDRVFSCVSAALDATAAPLRSLSFASVGLSAPQTAEVLQRVYRLASTLEDLDISSCRFDSRSLEPLEALVVSPHRRLTRLRLLTLRLDTRNGIVAPLFDVFGRSSSLRSIQLSRHKTIASQACTLRCGEFDALLRYLSTPSFARLTCLQFIDFPQAAAKSAAAAAERAHVAAALDRNARLLSVNLKPLLPSSMVADTVRRNNAGAWSQPAIRARTMELCTALAPLDWPIYVTLDVLDAIAPLDATPQSTKIAVIEIVKRAANRSS